MTKYDTNRLIAQLRAKWGNRPCPMCQVGNWEVNDSIFQLMEFNQGNLVIGGTIIPLVPVTCKNCGNTVLLNAIVAGLLPPAAPVPNPPIPTTPGGWKLIKDRISKFSTEPWFFHTFGSVLIGAGLSTFIAIILGSFNSSTQPHASVIAWGVVVATSLSGGLCLLFSHQERTTKREQATDVVSQMLLIEQRYEHPSS